LSLVRTFPRIIKGYEMPGRCLVVIPMDDVASARINGRDIGQSLLLMSGAATCTVHEPEGRLVAIFSLRKEALNLDGLDDSHLLLELPAERLVGFQLLIRRLLEGAAHQPNEMQVPATRAATERLLLAELKWAMRAGKMASRDNQISRNSHQAIVNEIDRLLWLNPGRRMDAGTLAEDVGVSKRTLHNAMQGICGLSMAHYLRLKRLWMVRDQLRRGGPGLTVKASALAHGIHHMGEFSSLYKETFGEMPSKTLTDGRALDIGRKSPGNGSVDLEEAERLLRGLG
jgi:AraC family ethanolamine operon transcriptional activator